MSLRRLALIAILAPLTLAAPALAQSDAPDDDGPVAAVKPEMQIAQTASVRARDGAIRLRLTCPQGVQDRCTGSVRIVAGSTTLATGKAEVYNGSAGVFSFGMTRAGKAVFKKSAHVAVVVTITATDDRDGTGTTTTKLTIVRA